MKKQVPENKRFIELLKAHEALFGESIVMNKGKEILRKMNERTQNGITRPTLTRHWILFTAWTIPTKADTLQLN